jgi:hypothetical protein
MSSTEKGAVVVQVAPQKRRLNEGSTIRRRKPVFEDYVFFASAQRAAEKEEDGPK